MDGQHALEILTRSAGSQRRLASVVGISEEHISRMRTGKFPVPLTLIAIAELIEALPRKDWPGRWTERDLSTTVAEK